MHVITKTCVLFLWMHLLTFVQSQDCTLQQFVNGPHYDSNFDITGLDDSYAGGRQVRVSCSVGYTGFFKLICVEGRWQTRGNKCQPKSCGHPGDAQFADFHLEDGIDFVFGSKVVYTCHKGYQMVSRTKFRRCTAEGWDGVVPVCEAQQCPAIHVDSNVQVIGDPEDANYGNVVRFRCKLGSEVLEGSTEMYCDENGQWSGTEPKCTEIKCTAPLIANGVVLGGVQEYKENQVLNYQCDPQYKRAEERQSKCMKVVTKAEWSPTPACEIKCEVKLPALEGTRYEPASPNVFLPGDTLRVLCGEKHWIVDHQTTSAETTCQSDGKWSIRPLCHEVICSNPRDQNLYSWGVSRYDQKKLGDSAYYRCEYGYKSTSRNDQATCTRDGWTPKPLCRGTYCTKLNIENTDVSHYRRDHYYHNDRVQYTCRNGNKNTFTITCIEGGWTGIKRCVLLLPSDVPYGFIVGPYQDKLYYTCNDGYKLSTKGWWGEARCIGGVWSGLNQCIDKRLCGETPVIPNGKVNHQVNRGAQSSEIICNEGYYAQNRRLFCHNGKWLLAGPGLSFETICEPTAVHCSPPPKIQNAVVLSSYQKEYLSDSEVTYQCRDKFIMEGEDTIRCNAGQWEEKNITSYCGKLNNEKQSMNFTSDKDKYMNGDVIEYQCIVPDPEAEGNATCTDGKWIKTVECKVKPCPHPDETPNGSFQITEGEDFVFGTAIQYVCNQGYQMVGKDTLNCSLDGWTGKAPTCNRKSQYQKQLCFKFRQLILILLCSVDIRILVSTLRGFVDIIFCQVSTKKFSEIITCEVGVLHHDLIVTGMLSASETVPVGDKLLFDCSSEFQLDGSKETECLPTGQWSAPFPTCSGLAANVVVTPRLSGQTLTKGQKLTFSCSQRGQFIQGNATVECLANGQWSDSFPTCGAPVGCGKPPPLADGDTKETVGFLYRHNAKVEYICQNVYRMEGGPFKICKNGEWTGQMRCLKPCTVDKDVMRRHNITFTYSSEEKLYAPHNDVIHFSCIYGTRRVDRVGMRQKCIDGVMNFPTCG
uniref:Sushi domain-containing protein n=1 Tax=Amphiprion ocellaris TaxID=80972 RepID=A0A3Q1B2W6_AMPOC